MLENAREPRIRFTASIGIAHTRWATHGAPNEGNAHPHIDCTNTIAVVHNGIIENYSALRKMLEMQGHTFKSETDTEVLAHLIEAAMRDGEPLEDAVIDALKLVEGHLRHRRDLEHGSRTRSSAARKGSPLLVGLGDGEYFVACDVAAILEHTRQVVYLDDGEMAVLTQGSATRCSTSTRAACSKGVSRIDWALDEIEKGGFEHFMLKEIFEQPQTIQNTMRGRLVVDEGIAQARRSEPHDGRAASIDQRHHHGLRHGWHSGLIGEYVLEELARIPVEVEYASEFRYRNPIVDDRTLCVVDLAVGRDGRHAGGDARGEAPRREDARARERRRLDHRARGRRRHLPARRAGDRRRVDQGVHEPGHRARAAHAEARAPAQHVASSTGQEIARRCCALPEQIQSILDRATEIEKLAERFKNATNFLYLGRGYNFPVALEGALKLKEISYIHAEGYPAAEMKHGPIALIDEEMPVVFVAPHDAVFEKVVSNIQEVKARGGKIICITSQDEPVLEGMIDHVIRVPQTIDMLYPLLTVIPLQLLAYYIAVKRGLQRRPAAEPGEVRDGGVNIQPLDLCVHASVLFMHERYCQEPVRRAPRTILETAHALEARLEAALGEAGLSAPNSRS